MNGITPPTGPVSWEQVVLWVAFFALQAWTIYNQSQLAKQQRDNHALMNSRLTELQAQTRIAAHAEGVEAERNRPKGGDERLEEIRGES